MLVLPFLLVASTLLTIATTDKHTSGNTDQSDVKKMEIDKKMYGGKLIAPPPDKVTVTEEIWLNLTISDYYGNGSHLTQKVVIGCFGKLTPITCLNYISLAKGYTKGRTFMGYKGTSVQKIVRDFMIQLGDVKTKYANGDSIFGTSFQDESFALSHNRAGWVGMANFGPDTNGSQFYILLHSSKWLDGKHVVFGKVLEGMDALLKIAEEETGSSNNPLRDITVEDSGVIGIKSPYILTAEQLETDGDIHTGRN
uniref:Peptidyl-prolyl cis-trans isomerase n=1 Tax=Arion vulgaris TaxID=1028688 RepID=A0A0B6YTU6_9EUPU